MAHLHDAETAAMPTQLIPKSIDKPDELIPNPDYATWVSKDQQVFNYLISFVSSDVQVQVSTYTTAAEI